MADQGQRNSVDVLRHELEHIELQQQTIPISPVVRRSSLSPPVGTAPQRSTSTTRAPRTSHDSTRGPARIRFSEDLLDSSRRPSWTANRGSQRQQASNLQVNPGLYTIESNVDPDRAHDRRRHEGQIPAIPGSPTRTSRAGEPSPTRSRYSAYRAYSYDVSPARDPVSQQSDGFRSHMKGAVVSAAETNETLAKYRDWVARQRERKRRWANGPAGRIKATCRRAYKQYILEGLLRQRPLPPSLDGRHIPIEPGLARRIPLIDERSGKPYLTNFIRSSRYTVWSFLPKQLFFQFSKLANFYFLLIGIMQMIPGLSTTGSYTTIGPLIAFVTLSMAKEGWDDYRRYRLDKTENRSEAWVLDPDGAVANGSQGGGKGLLGLFEGKEAKTKNSETELETREHAEGNSEPWSRVLWQELKVGDIIRLRRDDNIPADIVLLHATGPNGIAYIETMALDGETNLKSKQSCRLFGENCRTLSGFSALSGATVVSEDPNLDLYNYQGRATVNGETLPLTTGEVVYRGSTLRNTDQAIGLVVNSGEECKIRMNASKNVYAKAPAMQDKVNRIVLILVVFVVLLSVGCTVGNEIWKGDYGYPWYIAGATVPIKEILIGFIIMFNTLIPLSLYVSLEIVKLGQLLLLQDADMYDPVSDTPMVANTTTILEDLGQISYVFSDKTGTLTENVMKFRKMSVAGTAWLHDMDLQKEAKDELRSDGSVVASQSPTPTRTSQNLPRRSTTTISGWKPTPRAATAQPELKTEDLMEYIRRKPNTPFSRRARHFILCIALCHTCLPETDDKGEITYQAASPDELALVEAAKDLGYLVIDRPTQSIKLQYRDVDGTTITENYEVLDVIEFSSKRKRMSIVIRMPDGKICIFCKGADSLILPRLKQSQVAAEKATAVERRATMRKSMEQASALHRLSTQTNPRKSLQQARKSIQQAREAHRRSLRKPGTSAKRSLSQGRRSSVVMDEIDTWLRRRETEDMDEQMGATPRHSFDMLSPVSDTHNGLVDEKLALDDAAIFERCFQHLDDFATEGLRTLLYAYRYVDDDEYNKWKATYHEATTSLVNRQEQIEAAAELIEQGFDLAGATAIEDKLQQGVPDTIDKLRRANIKVWMLTGDKRETAINIAQSARICKPFSELYILDASEGSGTSDLQQKLATTLIDVGRGMIPHSVVVIDGHTLSIVEEDETLSSLFFDLAARVDSVICCRASPSQKATLVKCIRHRVPRSMTLAIGDGANDIAMIQASHVGIGISGREGLQAARVADYSIAQFRFLQRLLFVHGRWNYVRTGKYILATFWKEIVFYLVQAQYQRYNGYTGTSLYEPASLAVFNTLFTSLCVIFLGIFEQDLQASTLLAIPELYTFGQRNKGFSFRLYIGWTLTSAIEAILIYHLVYLAFLPSFPTTDTTLFAMGDLAFTICVIFINVKMLVLEMHTQTWVTAAALLISVGGWFLWNIFLALIYKPLTGPYVVRDGFLKNFGRNLSWWVALVVVLAVVVVFELVLASLRRTFWPREGDLVQELERDEGVMRVLEEHAVEGGEASGPVGETGGGEIEGNVSGTAMSKKSGRVSVQVHVVGEESGSGSSKGDGKGKGVVGDTQDEGGLWLRETAMVSPVDTRASSMDRRGRH